MGFLELITSTSFKEKVVVIPFGLEKTVSYGGWYQKWSKGNYKSIPPSRIV